MGLLWSGINQIVCRGQEIVDGVAEWYLLGMSLLTGETGKMDGVGGRYVPRMSHSAWVETGRDGRYGGMVSSKISHSGWRKVGGCVVVGIVSLRYAPIGGSI